MLWYSETKQEIKNPPIETWGLGRSKLKGNLYTGEGIYVKRIAIKSGQQGVGFDISRLKPGKYYIEVYSGKDTYRTAFVKKPVRQAKPAIKSLIGKG